MTSLIVLTYFIGFNLYDISSHILGLQDILITPSKQLFCFRLEIYKIFILFQNSDSF